MLRRLMMASNSVAPVIPAMRFWRIYITENNGDISYTGIGEWELATSPGGMNIANERVSQGASSSFTPGGSGDPSQAFDGDKTSPSNGWVTSAGQAIPSWISIDFGSNPKSISEIRLFNQVNQQSRCPKDFVLQYSESGFSWTDAISITGATIWVNEIANVYEVI